MKYGDIYWVKPDPTIGSEQAGRRPGLVISADEAIEAIRTVVTVVPLTTRRRDWVTRVPVTGPEVGLQEPSWGICEQVRTVSVDRVGARVGEADERTLAEVRRVLRYLLNLE